MKFRFYAIKLSGITSFIFIIQTYLKGFTELLILNQEKYFQVWRFLTAIFLHSSVIHLIYNLFALVIFGSVLESLIGGKKFLKIFFVSGILANLISINFYPSSLGASGAIFGILGALIIIRPNLTVWVFNLPMPIFVAGILWTAGDILGAYGFLTGNPVNSTGNIAHLSGMLFGLIFGKLYKKFSPIIKKKKQTIKLNEQTVRNWEDRFMH